MNAGKLLTGVLAGFAAGVALGILIAPDKGSETRKQILDKGEGYADDLKGKFDDFVTSLNKKYQSTLQKVEGLVNKEASKLENVKTDKA